MVFNENTNYDFILLSKQGCTQLNSQLYMFLKISGGSPVVLPVIAVSASKTCQYHLETRAAKVWDLVQSDQWKLATQTGQLCSKQTQRHFWSVHSCSKKTRYFVPIACQCMLAICGANTRRLVWSEYILHITMPIELCITHTEKCECSPTPKLTIVSRPLMPC